MDVTLYKDIIRPEDQIADGNPKPVHYLSYVVVIPTGGKTMNIPMFKARFEELLHDADVPLTKNAVLPAGSAIEIVTAETTVSSAPVSSIVIQQKASTSAESSTLSVSTTTTLPISTSEVPVTTSEKVAALVKSETTVSVPSVAVADTTATANISSTTAHSITESSSSEKSTLSVSSMTSLPIHVITVDKTDGQVKSETTVLVPSISLAGIATTSASTSIPSSNQVANNVTESSSTERSTLLINDTTIQPILISEIPASIAKKTDVSETTVSVTSVTVADTAITAARTPVTSVTHELHNITESSHKIENVTAELVGQATIIDSSKEREGGKNSSEALTVDQNSTITKASSVAVRILTIMKYQRFP